MFYSLRAEQPQPLINEEVLKVGVELFTRFTINFIVIHSSIPDRYTVERLILQPGQFSPIQDSLYNVAKCKNWHPEFIQEIEHITNS